MSFFTCLRNARHKGRGEGRDVKCISLLNVLPCFPKKEEFPRLSSFPREPKDRVSIIGGSPRAWNRGDLLVFHDSKQNIAEKHNFPLRGVSWWPISVPRSIRISSGNEFPHPRLFPSSSPAMESETVWSFRFLRSSRVLLYKSTASPSYYEWSRRKERKKERKVHFSNTPTRVERGDNQPRRNPLNQGPSSTVLVTSFKQEGNKVCRELMRNIV